ncbi:MAG: efflux RND transporter periplasmic adaptor subunit, partial [Saprospiraceae bacterium]
MKSTTIKISLVALAAALLGLGAGYVLFGKNKTSAPEVSTHSTTTERSEQIWTCSMHPQIRQPEPGDCALCGMDLIPLSTESSDDPLVLQMTDEAVKLANIQTTTVGGGMENQAKVISLSGKIQADERWAATQVAHVPGRIEKLFVSFKGERVQKGQKIASIYAPDLITAQRELLEALKLAELSPGLLTAARTKLRYWKIDPTVIAAIEASGEIQENFILYADATGIVTNRSVAVGDYLSKGEPLFELMNLDQVWSVFDAYEEDLASIAIGDQIAFTTPAIPNKTFKAKVSFIDPMIDAQTRVAAIRTEIRNTNGKLKPEMLVSGQLQKRTKSASISLTVPKSAVLWTGKKSVVYVKVPEMDIPSFQFRVIELGENLGDRYQVTAGLEVGEEVVTYGNFTLDAAAQLNNQASMMNQMVKVKKEETGLTPSFQALVPEIFKKRLHEVAESYLILKDALVQTDNTAAAQAAQAFLKVLAKAEVNLTNP